MEPEVIYEDGELVVLNKPSGWVVNEAKTTGNNPVVQTWIKENFKFEILNFKTFRDGIVHRLDKETSGVLLVAKTKEAFEFLQKQFKDRLVKKEYLCLVHGKVELEKGTIEVPVGRLSWNRERFGVVSGGRKARTDYKVKEYYFTKDETFTKVIAFPKTGRTHQIRVHMKYLGYPIVSDPFYVGKKRLRKDREWCPRLFLHAYRISFSHPGSKKKVSFKADLPKDLENALLCLKEKVGGGFGVEAG